MNSHHNKNNKKYKHNSFKKREIKVRFLAFMVIILAIICAICIISNSQKNKETFSQIDSYNNTTDYIEDIVSVELPSTSVDVDDNTTDENNTDTNENTIITNDNTTTNKNQTVSNSKYYIKINYGANVVTVYTKDSNGNYTVPVKAMVCSTGTATPKSGVYSIPARWRWGVLFGNVYGQYCIKITGNILFHSVPYLENGNPASLEYWEYDKLGTSASAGCVRLTVADALWLYNNCANGTQVEFYSSSNPGPLGKPTALKISQYDSPYKNWDPTDPNSSNPWKNGSTDNNTSSDDQNNNTTDTNSNVNNSNTSTENNTSVDNSNNITNDTIDNNINNNTNENSTIESINNTVNNNTNNSIDNSTVNSINNTTSSSNNTITNNSVENNSISNNTIENDTGNNSQN